ncbi:hypothetical protein L9F63_013341, partial [Diploptera punctata]
SKSCPQCRQKTTEKSIHRIYFNVASNENEDDSSVLHNKIDSLKFQLSLKEKDVKNESEENAKLKIQNQGLREEIIKSEKTIQSLKATMASLKDQIRYLKAQNESAEAAIEETKRLRKHLEFLRSIETVVQGSIAEVDDILNQHGDSFESRKSLATYVSVLKREVQSTSEKKKELREKLRRYQRELNTVNSEKQHFQKETNLKSELYKQLTEDFHHLEQENKSLQKKVHELEKAIVSPSGNNPRDNALRRLLAESPLPEVVKRPRLTNPSEQDTSISVMFENVSSADNPKKKSPPTTPYLKLKSSSIGFEPLKVSQSSNLHLASSTNKYSIFNKKKETKLSSMATNFGEAYDGMGGHSKLDDFPVPIPRTKSSTKIKNKTTSLMKQSSLC